MAHDDRPPIDADSPVRNRRYSSSFGKTDSLNRLWQLRHNIGFSLQLHGHRPSGVDGLRVAGMTLCLLARDV